MRVRVLMSIAHPEYRLVVPVASGMEGVAANLREAIRQLGGWEERSQDDLDENRPERREMLKDIAIHGACLWMVSAAYIGRVEVVPTGSLTA